MPKKFGRLALHMWTIDTTPLATALDAARNAGFDAVELRRTDFKRCFDAEGVKYRESKAPGRALQVFAQDPAGNQLEFFQPPVWVND